MPSTNEIGRDGNSLGGRSEHELARVKNKGIVVVSFDQLGQFFQVLLHVDMAERVVTEDAEVAIEAKID